MQAHSALLLGVTTTAIAAAANLLLSAHTHAMFSVAGDHSALQRCLGSLVVSCVAKACLLQCTHILLRGACQH